MTHYALSAHALAAWRNHRRARRDRWAERRVCLVADRIGRIAEDRAWATARGNR